MSAPIKTKEELTRFAWLVELRRQGDRKCTDTYRDDDGGVCALGLLMEIGGEPRGAFPEDIGALAGLSELQSSAIVEMNDGELGHHKHTFAEIADVVEGWFRS